MSMYEEEDRACEFLHLGSGWKATTEDQGKLLVKQLYSACLDADLVCSEMTCRSAQSLRFECKAPKSLGLLHRQGSNRATPYTKYTKGVSLETELVRRRGKGGDCIESCREQEQSAQSCNQANFENLSLGPGYPCFDAMDLHI